MRCRPLLTLLVLAGAPVAASAQDNADDFALRDGDNVVFFGDSNTEWGSFPRIVENYSVLRFPGRRINFINAGMDGDMASKAFFRFDRDVAGAGATVVFVMFGINDISWGNYAGPEFQKTFIDYTLRIVDAARRHHMRVYLLSYPITGTPTGDRASDPYLRFVSSLTATDTSLMQRLGDETMRLARAHGALTIDTEREMRRIKANAPPDTRFHQDDGAHLNELGNEVLAFVLLKGLGAPRIVSSVSIDAAKQQAVSSSGATVSNIRGSPLTGLSFARVDRGLPITFGVARDPIGAWIERIFEPVNGYFLTVGSLPAGGRFHVEVDGTSLSPACGFTSERLARRVNLAAIGSNYGARKGTWADQAMALELATEATAALQKAFSYPDVSELEASGWKTAKTRLRGAIATAHEAQRALAMPRLYHYSLIPLPADSVTRCARAQQ